VSIYDPSAEAEVRRELGPHEDLLWSGRPRGGIRFRAQDLFLIPFSLLWAGFAVFWEAMVLIAGAPLFFALWGIPFILVGAYITVGRFVHDALRRRRTAYGLTDRRVLIVTNIFGRRATSLDLATLGEITITEKADRSGTITFGPTSWFAAQGMGWSSGRGAGTAPSFETIEDVRSVFDQIQAAQRALRTAPID
jgi:hypothetical protein